MTTYAERTVTRLQTQLPSLTTICVCVRLASQSVLKASRNELGDPWPPCLELACPGLPAPGSTDKDGQDRLPQAREGGAETSHHDANSLKNAGSQERAVQERESFPDLPKWWILTILAFGQAKNSTKHDKMAPITQEHQLVDLGQKSLLSASVSLRIDGNVDAPPWPSH